MNQLMVTKREIIEKVNALPPEALPELQAFIEFLRFKSGIKPKHLIQLSGLWNDLPPVTEEDIVEVRREMWRSALEATFGMWADRDDDVGDGVSFVQNARRGHRLNDLPKHADETELM